MDENRGMLSFTFCFFLIFPLSILFSLVWFLFPAPFLLLHYSYEPGIAQEVLHYRAKLGKNWYESSLSLNHLVREVGCIMLIMFKNQTSSNQFTLFLRTPQMIFRNLIVCVLLPLLVLYPIFSFYHSAYSSSENLGIFVLLALCNCICYLSEL